MWGVIGTNCEDTEDVCGRKYIVVLGIRNILSVLVYKEVYGCVDSWERGEVALTCADEVFGKLG